MGNSSIAIIGSGIGGIASAIRLKAMGNDVTVFEANTYPGGKLSEIQIGPYRFDAGPSLFTLPNLVDELFTLMGENPRNHFNYQKLEVNCHYFYPDGTLLRAFSDKHKLTEEISSKTDEDLENIDSALSNSQFLYENLSDLFIFSSIQQLKTFLSKSAIKAYKNIFKLGFFGTLNSSNVRRFKDPRLVQFFNRYATYNGSSPYKTPATMNIIPHLEMNIGAFIPKGGMHQITLSLYDLALRHGVKFEFNSPVLEILTQNNQVKGIRIDETEMPFDKVISNMDIVNTYKKLLPDTKAPKFLLKQPKSSSALIFYWGIRKQFDQLDLHNIMFSSDYKAEFDHIFNKGSIYHDPTVYINITSKYEPKDAPEGSENWFVMINVPNNQGQNWGEMVTEAKKQIIRKISKTLKTDIEELIEVEEVLDPILIEQKTSSSQGALYGNSSNNLFAAFLRHANKSKRIKGLYHCGGSVHPGGGIPLSLSSAKLVADLFE
jgi:phytoene desaturase